MTNRTHHAGWIIVTAAIAAGPVWAQQVGSAQRPAPSEAEKAMTDGEKATPRKNAASVAGLQRQLLIDPKEVVVERTATAVEGVPSAVLRVGSEEQVPDAALKEGVWETLPDGRRIWRMMFRSPGAKGLRVEFTDFRAGQGRVWVYDGSPSSEPEAFGPYTGNGPHDDGEFWSDVILSTDRVVVEYESADRSGAETFPPFRVGKISHLFLIPGMDAPPPQLSPLDAGQDHARRMSVVSESPEDQFRAGARCHTDYSCASERWTMQGRSVAIYIFQSGGGTGYCTGTLLNTLEQNFTPYFLTANHCISTDREARSATLVWFFQSASCNGPLLPVQQLPRQRVARLLATAGADGGDFSLLLLDGAPPREAVYSGWNATDAPEFGSFVVGIHHPAGTFKKISGGNRFPDRDAIFSDHDGNRYRAPADRFYRVRWQIGHTEGGSSGSPMFNADGQVVGVLSHGNSECRRGEDGYGKFSAFFDQLKEWLAADRM